MQELRKAASLDEVMMEKKSGKNGGRRKSQTP
jgi:hypothetical protein